MVSKSLCLANSSYLRDYFKYKKTPVYLESKVIEIDKDKVIIEKDGKQITIKTDSTIRAVGYRPNPLTKSSKHVHVIGDAEKVGNLRTVIWRAWEVAEKI